MKLLTADQILGANDVAFEDVACPEWAPEGEADPSSFGVRVRRLSGPERRAYEISTSANDTDFDLRTALVAACACDETLKPLFTREQMKKLAEKSAVPIVRLFKACDRLNDLGYFKSETEKNSQSPEAGSDS